MAILVVLLVINGCFVFYVLPRSVEDDPVVIQNTTQPQIVTTTTTVYPQSEPYIQPIVQPVQNGQHVIPPPQYNTYSPYPQNYP